MIQITVVIYTNLNILEREISLGSDNVKSCGTKNEGYYFQVTKVSEVSV